MEVLSNIPTLYRFVFLYLEPFLAIGAAMQTHFTPKAFLNTMSQTSEYAPDNQVIYDQVAALYTLFAFNEAVLLRLTNDIRVWKGVFVGIFICDILHLYASCASLGGDVFWNPRAWRVEDWANLGSLWGLGVVRVAFLAGVGFQQTDGRIKSK
ncbi:uncharacterized protein NECHADRAFT_52470 [Fusarium vanettenii 77-13-4]|uniref:DUF7704 domain-containing protein n=1 Tax=Fusarium vanettenii (strain ATCC MYA-4622 / CBS 123669 / FGSC 9596 / NRRL 45880 / 77-13-4) TaxID=660122 RepID=C7ZK71_FUSV7|nr:uncharacterized protein NECHADRAFT_52470 [Fusarium vanettenii 77-13-4]EEU35623.1 hypothetical protein NECHADRAFT_52470 [Fusarium vanettenii 77-13-4]